MRNRGRWGEKENIFLPGDWTLEWELCNDGMRLPNRGAPGIARVTTNEFEKRLEEEPAHLKKDLEGWSYEPKPMRRVEIPKLGGRRVRLLGVYCIRDRVVQATLKLLMELLIDPYFSQNSYGFRPGRNQHGCLK